MVSGILGHPMAEDHHAAILALPWASASTADLLAHDSLSAIM